MLYIRQISKSKTLTSTHLFNHQMLLPSTPSSKMQVKDVVFIPIREILCINDLMTSLILHGEFKNTALQVKSWKPAIRAGGCPHTGNPHT